MPYSDVEDDYIVEKSDQRVKYSQDYLAKIKYEGEREN